MTEISSPNSAVGLRDHHRQAIDRLADAYRDDPHYRAIIIGGSVAKGFARDDSDVEWSWMSGSTPIEDG